jgi:hypothetical protein
MGIPIHYRAGETRGSEIISFICCRLLFVQLRIRLDVIANPGVRIHDTASSSTHTHKRSVRAYYSTVRAGREA